MAENQKPPQRIPAPNAGTSNPATIIFLHGYDDDADGWINIAQQFHAANKLPHLTWVFPNAPWNLEAMANAWYTPTSFSPIPVGRSAQSSVQKEEEEDEDEFNEEGEEEILKSVEYLSGLIDGEVKNGVKLERIVIGGFSQGCAVSLVTALASRYQGKIGAVVGLSGYLPRGKKIMEGRRNIGTRHLLGRNLQRPLPALPQDGLSSSSVPISVGFANTLHVITISIGNPPQSFRAFLDFGSSGLVIPSVQTPGIPKDPVPHRYNSFLSNSYRQNGTQVESSVLYETFAGFLSRDELQLSGDPVLSSKLEMVSDFRIPDMLFQEASDMRFREQSCALCDQPFDTVFPLAPYNASYEHNFMSPIARLVESDSLDHNIFSLRLSQGPTDDSGWLLLGAPPPWGSYDHDDSFKKLHPSDLPIPRVPYLVPGFAKGDKWKFRINSFAFGNDSAIHKEYTTPTVAIVDISYPFIGLTDSLVEAMNKAMDAETWGPFAWVNCSTRHLLPNVTIVLAGQKFELTAFEYTLEEWDDDKMQGPMYCQSIFMPIAEEEDPLVLIGSAFLRPLITVWDLEERSMSCEWLTPTPI
ncbi:hypothetical protein EG329_000651 [Mollisiaceae sp. DMI_Dod_QoI]|nr:hypothetical protein EG329_000651 [Helotiales sp. DMI_Dod_QoI]